jgi:hypothetical protein
MRENRRYGSEGGEVKPLYLILSVIYEKLRVKFKKDE